LEVRDYILKTIGDDAKEKYSKHITSYFIKEGGVCYIKTKSNYVHIGWHRGTRIDDIYSLLEGNGKIVKGMRVDTLNEKYKEIIKDYINQTIIILIEAYEMKRLKS
jgi:hypothetical protein